MRRLMIASVVALVLAACATSPTGRRQLHLFPEDQMDSMGVQAYQQMQEQTPTLDGGPVVRYVECVTRALLEHVPAEYASEENWEVTVFRSEAVNAFALPGGKIGVYTGLLEVAETPAQLAAVIGHEIGHVMAEHGNERMSTQMATSVGLTAAAMLAGDSPESRAGLALLGLGAQVGVLLPFSRTHESEADRIGLELMAEAGFDPREAVALWRNMAEASGGGGPPEFLSTHPSEQTRISRLQDQMPQALEKYERARFDGATPQCTPPENVPTS
jgi:predicted Zn-dependent protease